MKKMLFWIFVLILLVNLASAETIGEKVKQSFTKLGNFEQIYDKSPNSWDFLIFGAIFALVAWLGLSKWFGETNKGAAVGLALVLGIGMGIAAVKGGLSFKLFIPFVKNLFFFIVVTVLFFILANTMLKENKVVAFIIALVATFIIFNMSGLFTQFKFEGFLEGKETIADINAELDKLAGDVGVKDDAYNLLNDIKDEKQKLESKIARISPAIDSKIAELEGKIVAEADEAKKSGLQKELKTWQDRKTALNDLKARGLAIIAKTAAVSPEAQKEAEQPYIIVPYEEPRIVAEPAPPAAPNPNVALYNDALGKANAAFDARNYETALEQYKTALGLADAAGVAADEKKKVSERITFIEALLKKYDQLVADGDKFYADGKKQEARNAYAEAYRIKQDPRIKARLEELERDLVAAIPKGDLKVSVKDEAGNPVAGADVGIGNVPMGGPVILWVRGLTGADGTIILSDDARERFLTVTKEGYEPIERKVTIEAAQSTPVDVVLKKKGAAAPAAGKGELKIVVHDAEGKPVVNANVRLLKSGAGALDLKLVDQKTTPADGTVNFTPDAGNYVVEVIHAEYVKQSHEATIEAGKKLGSIYILQKVGGAPAAEAKTKVTVTVKDTENKGVQNANVMLSQAGEVKYKGTTDANGVFAIDDAAPGEYKVEISLAGYDSVSTTINVPAGGLDFPTTLIKQDIDALRKQYQDAYSKGQAAYLDARYAEALPDLKKALEIGEPNKEKLGIQETEIQQIKELIKVCEEKTGKKGASWLWFILIPVVLAAGGLGVAGWRNRGSIGTVLRGVKDKIKNIFKRKPPVPEIDFDRLGKIINRKKAVIERMKQLSDEFKNLFTADPGHLLYKENKKELKEFFINIDTLSKINVRLRTNLLSNMKSLTDADYQDAANKHTILIGSLRTFAEKKAYLDELKKDFSDPFSHKQFSVYSHMQGHQDQIDDVNSRIDAIQREEDLESEENKLLIKKLEIMRHVYTELSALDAIYNLQDTKLANLTDEINRIQQKLDEPGKINWDSIQENLKREYMNIDTIKKSFFDGIPGTVERSEYQIYTEIAKDERVNTHIGRLLAEFDDPADEMSELNRLQILGFVVIISKPKEITEEEAKFEVKGYDGSSMEEPSLQYSPSRNWADASPTLIRVTIAADNTFKVKRNEVGNLGIVFLRLRVKNSVTHNWFNSNPRVLIFKALEPKQEISIDKIDVGWKKLPDDRQRELERLTNELHQKEAENDFDAAERLNEHIKDIEKEQKAGAVRLKVKGYDRATMKNCKVRYSDTEEMDMTIDIDIADRDISDQGEIRIPIGQFSSLDKELYFAVEFTKGVENIGTKPVLFDLRRAKVRVHKTV